MNYHEFKKFALDHYNEGGDAYYECWDERTFTDYVEQFGVIDKSVARRLFCLAETERKEIESTAW